MHLSSRKGAGQNLKLMWVRRSDYGIQGPGADFAVKEVLPAEPPAMQGIQGYLYHDGIYVNEGGVEKALYLELKKPVDHVRGSVNDGCKIHLFACKNVSEAMVQALHSGGAVGQNFQPRRGVAGYVIRGNLPFDADPTGYVWQESHGGAITFWYMTPGGDALEFKQWNKMAPVFLKQEDGDWLEARPATGKWQHEDVQEWAPTLGLDDPDESQPADFY